MSKDIKELERIRVEIDQFERLQDLCQAKISELVKRYQEIIKRSRKNAG